MITLEKLGYENYDDEYKEVIKEVIKKTKFEIAKKLIIKDVSLYNVSYACDIGMATLGELKESLEK